MKIGHVGDTMHSGIVFNYANHLPGIASMT